MNLACTMAPGRGDTDLLLAGLAASLGARGIRCCGTVQINTGRPDGGPCDMDVKILPDGQTLRISQSLGRKARGCRLNPSALETAVSEVAARLDNRCDLLIINKFGKHEAEGCGFREVIAAALCMGVPVLVGLNALNRPAFSAFSAFSGGLATCLPPVPGALNAWMDAALRARPQPA